MSAPWPVRTGVYKSIGTSDTPLLISQNPNQNNCVCIHSF